MKTNRLMPCVRSPTARESLRSQWSCFEAKLQAPLSPQEGLTTLVGTPSFSLMDLTKHMLNLMLQLKILYLTGIKP